MTFKKISIGFAGFIVVMILAVWIILAFFNKDIRLKVEQSIDRQINAQVYFDDLSASLFKDFPNLTLTLHNLTIVGEDVFAKDTLATTDELDIEIKTSTLFSGETEMKSVHFHNPRLYFKILKNGKANYDILPKDSVKAASPDSSYVSVALDQVNISDGEIIYDDQSTDTYALMKGVEHRGVGNLRDDLFDFTTITTIKELTFDYGKVRFLSQKELDIDLIMQVNVKQRAVTLKENKIRINHFILGLEGSFAFLDNGFDLDLSFKTKGVDFKNIISLVPGIFMEDFKQISTKGQMSFDGFVSGQYIPDSGKLPSLLANIKITDALFKIDSLPDPVENIQMDMVITNYFGAIDSTIFDIKDFQFDMRKHITKGRLKVQGLSRYKIDADIISDIDLAELETMYPIKGIEMKGKVNLELQAKGVLRTDNQAIRHLPLYHLDLLLKDGHLKYNHLPAAIDSVQFHLVADNETGLLENTVVDFKNIHLNLDKNRVHGFLKMEGYQSLKVNTDLKADLDLADIETMFPMNGIVMKGKLAMDVKASGLYDSLKKKFPSVDAHITLADGYIKTSSYPEPMENIHLLGEAINTTGKLADTRITVNRLTYTLEGEPFDVSGEVSDLENYKYHVKAQGLIDLAKITKIYPIPGYSLTGLISSDVESRGRLIDVETGHYEKVKARGNVKVTDFGIKGAAILHPITISNASFTFNATKITLDTLRGKFGRSTVALKGDLLNYMSFVTRTNDAVKADLDLKCDTLDLNEWLLDAAATSTNDDAGTIKVWQIPPRLDAVFDSEIGYVLYEDIKMTHLDGEIKMKDGVLNLHETGFNTLNAEFNVSGDYDTHDMTHPRFDVDLNIKELDISRAYHEMKLVRDLLPAAGDAEGKFSIDYKLKGELLSDFSPKMATLIGGGEMRISNAKINGMKIFEELSKASKKSEVNDPHLKDFVMRSEIRDNKIIIKPFSINVSGFETDVEGVSEISGTIRYVMKVGLPPFGVKVPFHVTGTYSNPKISVGKGHVIQASDSLAN